MKFLLLSDIHSSMDKLEKILTSANYDAVLIAGDLTQFRPKDARVVDEMLSEYTDSALLCTETATTKLFLGRITEF